MHHRVLNVLRRSRTLIAAHEVRAASDGDLLTRFVAQRDETAFSALMHRHSSLVLGVCRRILNHCQDAEDAFQATFLVLARKAGAIRRRDSIASWLHGVARRTALRLRAESCRRGTQHLGDVEPVALAAPPDALREAMQIVDEELVRLPAHYRAPLILCYLEGRTQDEAAGQLGWTLGAFRGRLERARDMLRGRLTRRGVSFPASLVGLGLGATAVPAALLSATVNAALPLGGQMAAGVSTVTLQVAEGVCRAMVMQKIRGAGIALGLALLTALGGVAIMPGLNGPARTAAADAPAKESPKPDAVDPNQLVKRLGDARFAEREEAEKSLASLGARAAASVRAGMKDADPEIAKRCTAIWPRLWEAEIARPDADRLSGFTHPLWVRFRKVAGDDASSRKLFAELAADLRRFEMLEAIDADPAKAADAYATELKKRVEALNKGWHEADEANKNLTGLYGPKSGYPTQPEFATLLFLGTFPSTAAVTYRGTGDPHDSRSHSMVFALGQAQSPAMRRLFAAWLETRSDQGPIQLGLSQVVRVPIAEVLPAARKHAASAKLESGTRALAILVIARLGGGEDLPLLKRAFGDTRVWYSSKLSSGTGKEQTIEVQVGDTALGSALWIFGQRAADFDFPIAEMLRNHPDTLGQYGMLGFLDNDTRQAAHKKAEAWLDEHKIDKATRYQVKDWQVLFDGKTTKNWKTEGQVTIEDGLLKVGGDKGGSIVTTASFARGSLSFAYRQAGDAKTTLTWRGKELAFSPALQGWTSQGYDPDAKGESPIRIVAPPGTTLWLRELAFRPY